MVQGFIITKASGAFILGLRERSVAPGENEESFRNIITSVTDEEIRYYRNFCNIMDDLYFIKNLEDDGWFNKTYGTVKEYVKIYVSKQRGGKNINYNSDSPNFPTKERIAKILYFCKIMGKDITPMEITLSREQKLIIGQKTGVSVYNSGPGCGKTTTAVHKTKSLMEEGVIVVSYTTAAVSNFYNKLVEIIDDVKYITRKKGDEYKKIHLSTIDLISRLPFPDKTAVSKDYKKQIEAALREKNLYREIFSDLTGNMIYKHLIVDEAQDVDDARFMLLLEIYSTCDFKSITFIGDPRQRLNINAGGMFQLLLENGIENQTNSDFNYTVENPFLVKSKISYRFQNPHLLDLCNILSSLRPKIHSQMTPGAPQITNVKFPKISENQASEIIFDLLEKKVSPSEIAIISPIVEKTSKIKKTYGTIIGEIQKKGIVTGDEINSNSIYCSSIHSVKGLEFEYVFFVGCSNFPSYMSGTYSDTNDGLSLNFVANTRAKKQIFYVTDDTHMPPNGVPEDLATGEKSREPAKQNIIHPKTIKTEDIEADEYQKMESNMRTIFSVPKEEQENLSFHGSQFIQNLKYEIISSVLMKIKGKTTPMQISNENPLSSEYYNIMKKRAEILDLKLTQKSKQDQYIFWNEKHKSFIEQIYAPYSSENISKHKIFRLIMTDKESDLTSMNEIAEPVMKISGLLEKYEGKIEFKQSIIQSHITASTIINEKVILIFTDSLYLGLYVKKLNPDKVVFTVSLSKGKIYKLEKTIYSLKRYEYQIKFIYSLFYHFKLLRSQGKYSISSFNNNEPELSIDAEFGPRSYNKSNTIYDYTVININDPFLSVATYILCDPCSFSPFCGDKSLKYVDFINCPTFDVVSELLRALYINKKPTLHYYHATHDLSIFYETEENFIERINDSRFEIIKNINDDNITKIFEENSPESVFCGDINSLKNPCFPYRSILTSEQKNIFDCHMIEIEIGNRELWKFELENFKSYRTENHRKTKKGTLSEIYALECQQNLSEFEHIDLHVSFPDALILAELVIKRKAELSTTA